jgi:hypothetical protein
MALTDHAKRFGRRSDSPAAGPPATFIAAVAAAFAVLGISAVMLPRDVVLPLVSVVFFALAALVALIAWRSAHRREPDRVNYWDVAGALTFIGICAASFVDPEQMVRLVEGSHRAD